MNKISTGKKIKNNEKRVFDETNTTYERKQKKNQ